MNHPQDMTQNMPTQQTGEMTSVSSTLAETALQKLHNDMTNYNEDMSRNRESKPSPQKTLGEIWVEAFNNSYDSLTDSCSNPTWQEMDEGDKRSIQYASQAIVDEVIRRDPHKVLNEALIKQEAKLQSEITRLKDREQKAGELIDVFVRIFETMELAIKNRLPDTADVLRKGLSQAKAWREGK